jgi:hypothetical protein
MQNPPYLTEVLISCLLFLHIFLTPMIISAIIKSKVIAAIFTFIPIFGMFSLNFIASELENPFGTDDNDLPLEHFQEEMNSCLLMLLHTNTDMIAGTSKNCITDFQELLKSVQEKEEGDDDGETAGFTRLSSYTPETYTEEEIAQHNKFQAELKTVQPHLLKPEPAAPAPTPAPAPAPVPAPVVPQDPQSRLLSNMEDFASSLQKWTQLLNSNTEQMNQNFDTLSNTKLR